MIIIPTNSSSVKSAIFESTISLTGSGNSLWGAVVVGSNLYVGDNSNPGKVFIVNTANNTQTGSITLGASSSRDMIVRGTKIYLAMPNGYTGFGAAQTIDTTTNTASNFYQFLGYNSWYIAGDESGDNVYVSQHDGNTSYNMRGYRQSGGYPTDSGTWFNPSPTVYGYSIAVAATGTTALSIKIFQSLATAGILVWRGDGTKLSTIANPAGTLAASTNYFAGQGMIYVGSNKIYHPGAGGEKIWILNTTTESVSGSITLPIASVGGTRVYSHSQPKFVSSRSRAYWVGNVYSDSLGTYVGVHLFEIDTTTDTCVGMYPIPKINSTISRTFGVNSDATKFYFPEYSGSNANIHVYSLPA